METGPFDDVRFRGTTAKPRLLPGLLAAALAALFWGALLRSLWVGAMTLALAAIPALVLRAGHAPVAARIALALLTGGAVGAIALLTHHAALP